MFAKIFSQIFDSSIAEDWQVRCVFTDLLTLCDVNGVVDMTPEAISRRTNVPLDIVKRGIEELQGPDPLSRSPDDDGRRIRLIDEHRPWGWMIINYEKYRQIASEEQRRQKTYDRVAKYRSKKVSSNGDVTQCNAPDTSANACNAMQREKQMQREKKKKDMTVEESIYAVYPKKVGKPYALKAINAAINRGNCPGEMFKQTEAYARAVRGTDTMIPNPQKWYNEERFNDDPSTWPHRSTNGESIHSLQKLSDAKNDRMAELKRKHYSDTQSLIGGTYVPAGWRDATAFEEFVRLKKERQTLTERISSHK